VRCYSELSRYYLDANNANPAELAVSAAQAGLDLLAFTYLVEDHQILTEAEYGPSKKRPAHKNLADFLDANGVDTSIPQTLPNLQSVAAATGCGNGLEILTRMRNRVIHPRRKKQKYTPDEWTDAWRLATRYLLLGILAYVGYQGTYRDPTAAQVWTGSVEWAPWHRGNP
jgi:hypothetical protein